MTRDDIINSVKSLKVKNSEGYDRIPQRVLIDGLGILVEPLTIFFNKVYMNREIPGQWLISKIIPVHKRAVGVIALTTDQSPIYAAPQNFLKK